MGLFKKKEGGTFFGNLLRGAVKQIPIIGGSLGNGGNMLAVNGAGKTNAELTGMSVKAFNSAIGSGKTPTIKEQAPPSVEAIQDLGGYPTKSSVFPNGADSTALEAVNITAQRSSVPNYNFDLDWKNGKVSTSTGNGIDNNVLLYGLLGLGALMLLKNK